MKDNYYLAKWLAGEMTAKELDVFKNSEDYDAYLKIKEASARLRTPEFDEQLVFENIIKATKAKKKYFVLNPWYIKIAAMLVLFVGIGFLYVNLQSTTKIAARGEQNSFELPDDSKVYLNAGSELKFTKYNWANERECTLLGEAFFTVAKGKVFDVITTQGKVTVVGTQFNVKVRNKRFEVECYEGKVKITFNDNIKVLTKGQNIVIQDGKQIASPDVDEKQPNWMHSEMRFISENLESVIAEIERQYNIEIDLKEHHKTQKFTGILPLNNINLALKIISTTYDLKLVKGGKNMTLQVNENTN